MTRKIIIAVGALILTLALSVGLAVLWNGDETLDIIKDFIHVQINCETYKEAAGDQEKLTKVFNRFFEEGAYEQYLDNVFGYMYPQLFYVTKAEKVKIKSIRKKEKQEYDTGDKKYVIQVKYQIIGKDKTKFNLVDQLEVKMTSQNKIENITVLNTSDVVKQLILDMNVH